jgi:WD40 repeat protein
LSCCYTNLNTKIRKNNQQILVQNQTFDFGRGIEALANKDIAIARSRDQRIIIGEISHTMQAMQKYQMMQNRDAHQTVRTMHNNQTAVQLSTNELHRTMLENQAILQMSSNQLYAFMLENNARIIKRMHTDQVNQRNLYLCVTVITAFFAYHLGALKSENSWLKSENSWLKAILLPTSIPAGQHVGEYVSTQLDPDLFRWLEPVFYESPNWNTAVHITVVWGYQALGLIFTSFQLLKIWNIYNSTEDKRSSLKDAFCMTLFCSPFRAAHLYTRVAYPAPWIIAGCLLDCFFLYSHVTRQEGKLLGHMDQVISVAFSPDGTKIASGSADRSVKIWDAATGKQLWDLKGHIDPIFSVMFSSDGTQVLSCSNYCALRIWDLSTGRQVEQLGSHKDISRCVAISPDGDTIVSNHAKYPWVSTFYTGSGDLREHHTSHEPQVTSVIFSPDSSKIASGSENGSVKIWDPNNQFQLHTLKGHTGAVCTVAFSPDGTLMASGSDDHSVRLWVISTQRQLEELNGHTDSVCSVVFSPDGTKIASGSNDGSVRLWDVTSRRQIQVFNGHTREVRSVAFSPDGTKVVSGSNDHSVCIWDI